MGSQRAPFLHKSYSFPLYLHVLNNLYNHVYYFHNLHVLHDIHLETVTNVEAVYPKRHRADGRYYARDFTLEELRNLRVHERANSDGKQVFENRYFYN